MEFCSDGSRLDGVGGLPYVSAIADKGKMADALDVGSVAHFNKNGVVPSALSDNGGLAVFDCSNIMWTNWKIGRIDGKSLALTAFNASTGKKT